MPSKGRVSEDRTTGIPGFRLYDEKNEMIAGNPKQSHAKGMRTYGEDGQRIWGVSEYARSKEKYHSYLVRIPKGAWKAFVMKCERNGVTKIDAIRALMRLWVNGTIDLDIRLYVK